MPSERHELGRTAQSSWPPMHRTSQSSSEDRLDAAISPRQPPRVPWDQAFSFVDKGPHLRFLPASTGEQTPGPADSPSESFTFRGHRQICAKHRPP
ncbi:hypothetical protein B0H10DRAFT_12643 [Mycena sp. CBHHK59/15]|nr:hypothetical protein B0H10DRAFT_12643 [Mycena sp. CBHHK59/15]